MKKGFSLTLVVMLVALLCAPVLAQGNSILTGTVSDSQGAVVPDAKVTATNVATNVSYTTQTTGAGVYRFPVLPVGTYRVMVEASGFKSTQVENVVLTVGQTVERDIALDVGVPSESVTIQAGGEQLVQTAESSLSTLLNKNVWETYPLENRNTNEFINLLPGAVPDAFAGSTRGAAVNGARGGTGNFLIEGYDNNDQGQGGRGSIVAGGITSISPEAIQEFRVITNNYSAQYGKGAGFVNDTVLRSGSNDLHGSLFIYNRVQALAANDFFSNSGGIEDSLVRNQFGGSFGGPIIKDKTFAFGTVEFHRLRQGAPITAVGFTEQFFNFVNSGQFANFHENNPNGVCGGGCPGAFSRSRTVGPVVSSLLAAQPVPFATSNFSNIGAGLFTEGIEYPVPVYGDITTTTKSEFNAGQFTIKADHTMSDTDRFSGTLAFEDSDTFNTVTGGDGAIGSDIFAPGRSILTGISYYHTFSPTIVNEFKVSYLRHRRDFPPIPGLEGLPSYVTGIDPLGVSLGQTSSLPQFFTENQFQYQDHLSFTRGVHSFRTGLEYRRTRNGSAFEALKNGLFLPHGVEEFLTDGFFGDEADLVFFGEPTFGGFTAAQAAVDPTNGGLPEFYRGFRANEFSAYFQDDWKIKNNLTLNLGLRWEYFGVPHNFRKGIDSNFFFGTGVTPVPNPSANPFFPVDSPIHARVATGQFQQRDNEIWNKDTNNFAPRVGFAWDVWGTEKLVVRGGGGVFYDRIWNNLFENIRFNAPFHSFISVGTFGNGVPVGPLSSPGLLTSPFTSTNQFLSPVLSPTGAPTPSPRHMDQNLVTPYNEQYFLGIQYQFLPDFMLETNYIGTLGRKLTGVIDINTFNGRSCGTLDTTGRNCVTARRVNPNLAADNFRTNAFKSAYHGFQVGVRNRTMHGLQFNAHYTFAKAIDEISDAFNARLGLTPTNNSNLRLDRGRADFDITHRFVTHFTYEVPFFKENRWIGGWVATGIVSLQSGVPFSIFHGGEDANANGAFTDRAVFIGSSALRDVIDNSGSPADGYFDPTQFEGMITRAMRLGPATACGAGNGVVLSDTQWWCDGTLGRNVLDGPGFANVDFGLHKKFRVTEGSTLQFQANAFNLFNHPNFGLPSRNLASSQVGRSTTTVAPGGGPGATGARVIQLALRLDF
ncbi:MAG: carboxypeptidase regulatory-like domain-containing protein [Blastocatellia bacterium]|nr:carboxypeptidase regulatory-like domain-containing protein [Blastocatellia bacterium]